MGRLISKKELLERYNISYGTLYRWKRMGLIPDDWLVKKSTFTGQETFFDEEQICQRVEAIISKKDSISLEAIARELLHHSKGETKLRILSRYGDKEFVFSDLQDVIIVKDDREESILEVIKGIAFSIDFKDESEENNHE